MHCKCIGCKNLDTETGTKVPLGLSTNAGDPGVSGTTSVPGQGLNLGERWFKPSTSLRSKLLQAPSPLDANDRGNSDVAFQKTNFLKPKSDLKSLYNR